MIEYELSYHGQFELIFSLKCFVNQSLQSTEIRWDAREGLKVVSLKSFGICLFRSKHVQRRMQQFVKEKEKKGERDKVYQREREKVRWRSACCERERGGRY